MANHLRVTRHTLAAEQDWAKKLGVRTPQDALLTDAGLNAHRDAYCNAIRVLHSQNNMARTCGCASAYCVALRRIRQTRVPR